MDARGMEQYGRSTNFRLLEPTLRWIKYPSYLTASICNTGSRKKSMQVLCLLALGVFRDSVDWSEVQQMLF